MRFGRAHHYYSVNVDFRGCHCEEAEGRRGNLKPLERWRLPRPQGGLAMTPIVSILTEYYIGLKNPGKLWCLQGLFDTMLK